MVPLLLDFGRVSTAQREALAKAQQAEAPALEQGEENQAVKQLNYSVSNGRTCYEDELTDQEKARVNEMIRAAAKHPGTNRGEALARVASRLPLRAELVTKPTIESQKSQPPWPPANPADAFKPPTK